MYVKAERYREAQAPQPADSKIPYTQEQKVATGSKQEASHSEQETVLGENAHAKKQGKKGKVHETRPWDVRN